MRDVLGSGYRRSLVHLAWMCLFSSVPVRGKPGPAHGAARLVLPGFDPLWRGSVPAPSHVPAHLKMPGMQAAGLGRRGCRSGAGEPAWQPAMASDPALGLQNGGAKVLEKTFEEWMRYRDECLRRMASEPYPAGTQLCPSAGSDVGMCRAG